MSALQYLSFPETLDSFLIAELASADPEPVVIHAGHYALVEDTNGKATDCLDESPFPGVDRGFSEFSRVTWRAACTAISQVQAPAQLMVLVNDWQFLSSKKGDQRSGKRAAAKMRDEYYRSVPTLPAFHLQQLMKYDLPADIIFRQNENRWLFSESTLRNELNATVAEVLTDEKRASDSGIRKYYDKNGEPIVEACDDDSGKFCLLYCGNTNCAGEVVSLLGNLHRRGVRRFLNIYPVQCREPVGVGTRLASRLFGIADFRITNVAVSGAVRSGDSLQAVVERFGPQAEIE